MNVREILRYTICAAFAILASIAISIFGHPWWGIGGGIAFFAFACKISKGM